MAAKASRTTRAWVITWHRGSVAPSPNEPGTPQGAPLALLPSRASRERVEGALVAMFQMISGSYPDLVIGHLRRRPTYRVEWDADENIAKIGHDIEVYAFRTEVHFDGTLKALEASDARGLIKFQPLKWVTQRERLDRIKAELEAGTYEWPDYVREVDPET